jgi:hypothetical protein
MPIKTVAGLALWGANIFLTATTGIIGWTVEREFRRNDEQEIRIRASENMGARFEEKLDNMIKLQDEIKKDLKEHTKL